MSNWNFVECISQLQKEFDERPVHKSRRKTFVTQPFSVEGKDAPTELQMQVINLQCNEFVKIKFSEALLPLTFIARRRRTLRKASQTEERRSTANISVWQHTPMRKLSSGIKQTKSKVRSSIADGHLKQLLLVCRL